MFSVAPLHSAHIFQADWICFSSPVVDKGWLASNGLIGFKGGAEK